MSEYETLEAALLMPDRFDAGIKEEEEEEEEEKKSIKTSTRRECLLLLFSFDFLESSPRLMTCVDYYNLTQLTRAASTDNFFHFLAAYCYVIGRQSMRRRKKKTLLVSLFIGLFNLAV